MRISPFTRLELAQLVSLSSCGDVSRLYLKRRREQKAASYAVRSGRAALIIGTLRGEGGKGLYFLK